MRRQDMFRAEQVGIFSFQYVLQRERLETLDTPSMEIPDMLRHILMNFIKVKRVHPARVLQVL